MDLHHVRRGSGRPIVLIHGLGSSWRTWTTILGPLAREREVVMVDLPGFGSSPKLRGASTVETLADATTSFLSAHGLERADVVGSSLGARLVLELARRGGVGSAVALSPGGFWTKRERVVFGSSIVASARLVRLLGPVAPALARHPIGRTLLFAQLSAHPWRIPSLVARSELHGFAHAPAFDEVLDALWHGPPQPGADATEGRVTIVWGTRDLVCLPRQAGRARRRFPTAQLLWLERCGHMPHWDRPDETARLVLAATG